MGCEICGRSSCMKSFHSLEEQEEFDSKFGDIKSDYESKILKKIERLFWEEIDGDLYIKKSEVEEIASDVLW